MRKTSIFIMTLLFITACQDEKKVEVAKVKVKIEQESVSQAEEVEKTYSKNFYICEFQGDINSCLDEELKLQDAKLNTAYKKATKAIQPFRVEELKKVQRAWMAYRDVKCGFLNHKESGSGGVTDALACEVTETISRTGELLGL